jgi:hypothetical protein
VQPEAGGTPEQPEAGARVPVLPREDEDPQYIEVPPAADTLADLDRENGKLIRRILHGLAALPSGSRIRFNRFLLNSEESPLGTYWRNQLSSALSSAPNRSFVVINEPEALTDYTLTGEFMRIGGVLRIYTRLTRLSDSALAAVWYLDVPITPFVETLLPGRAGAAAAGDTGVRPDSYEPDSKENPLETHIGAEPAARTIHHGDEDWFRIQTDAAGVLVVETRGAMDTYMELYAGDTGSRLASNDDGGENGNARIEYSVEAGKTYIAKVRGLGNATGSYQFVTAFTSIPVDAAEPNDTREQATDIEPNGEREASFHSASDADWYKITIPEEGGYVTVYTGGRMDTRITVYNEEGAVIADDDDSGSRLNARVAMPVSGGGVLYIKVVDIDGNRGTYTLTTTLRPLGQSDAYEDDNTMESAKPVGIGEAQERTFTTASDVDWVRLTVTGAGVYEIRTRSAGRTLDTCIELLDEYGEYFDEDDDGGENYDACLRTELDAGIYFLVIRTLDDDPLDNNSYTLIVSALAEE